MFKDYDLIQPISVSFAQKVNRRDVTTVGLDEIVRRMQTDTALEKAIAAIRATTDPSQKVELKKQLPYISFCSFKGNLRKSKNLISTRYLQFDIDHVVDLPGLRQRVEADPETFMSFKSPSGDGLKFVVRLQKEIKDHTYYKQFYILKKEEYEKRFNATLDKTTTDAARTCFLSHDPDVYINTGSTPVAVVIPKVPTAPVQSTSPAIAQPAAEFTIKKHKAALQGTTTGNRHGDLLSIVGHLIINGIDEEITIELMLGWNKLNEPPKGDQEIVDTVKDLYERYNKEKPEYFAGQCTDFWSMGTDFLQLGISGGRFLMSKIGKEKFHGFVGASEKEAKDAAFLYLLQHKHIKNINIVNHISDVTAAETSYEVNIAAGEVTVRYTPIEVRVKDNAFIEQYLSDAFGQYTTFIKEYLAAYCYTNFIDLPTLLLKGARGSGKNTFAEMMYAIFPTLSQTWEAKKGSFTPEAEMKLLIADETVSNSKEDYDMLKQYSGSKRVQVNKKYQIPYDVINNMNIVMMSNAAFPIAAAKEEKPTSESNNQFFVYEFKAFAGTIDPKLDQKLEDRIGYYVRTELKSVFDGLDFTGNRYSIETPITPEEAGLFEGNMTEEESVVEMLIDKVADMASVAGFNEWYRKLMETGWIPTELIKDRGTMLHVSLQAMVKQLQEQGYLVMAESKKQTVKGSGERMRCQQMTDKFIQEITFYDPKQ